MKNLIEPEKIEALLSKPANYETVAEFLESEPEVSAGYVCKLLKVPVTNFYAWRARQQKIQAKNQNQPTEPPSEVAATGVGKRKYTAEDKVALVRDYGRLSEEQRGSFLRSYGLYHSDLKSWQEVIERAAVEALAKKKQGPVGKTPDQLKIEELQRELQGQEKTIARLSAMVVVQKKISNILGIPEPI